MNPDTLEVRRFDSPDAARKAGFTVPMHEKDLGALLGKAESTADQIRMLTRSEIDRVEVRDITPVNYTPNNSTRRGYSHGGTSRKFKTRERVSR